MNRTEGDVTNPAQLIFGREPAAWVGALQAAISLATSLGLQLTNEQQGAIMALVSAILGAYLAYRVRPLSVAAYVAVLQAGISLGVAFGFDFTVEQQGIGLSISSMLLNMLLVRPQVEPSRGWISNELPRVGRHRKPDEEESSQGI